MENKGGGVNKAPPSCFAQKMHHGNKNVEPRKALLNLAPGAREKGKKKSSKRKKKGSKRVDKRKRKVYNKDKLKRARQESKIKKGEDENDKKRRN